MLSFMASEYFQRSPMLLYPLIALAVFMFVFIVVSVRAAMARGQELEAMARLPLDGSNTGDRVEAAFRAREREMESRHE